MQYRAVHRVQHGHGAHSLQELQDGGKTLRSERVQARSPKNSQTQQILSRMQERHQTELCHKMGDRRERKTGRLCRKLLLKCILVNS